MELGIVQGAYQNAVQDTNFQRCVNMYPIVSGPEGRGNGSLVPTQGTQLLVDLGEGAIRGIIVVGVYTYVVCGPSVYKLYINSNTKVVESQELLGTLSTTGGTVRFEVNPTQIILVDGSASGYIITIASGALAIVADVHLLGGTHVQYIDGYFIVNRPNTAIMQSSALNNGESWVALDEAAAAMRPDDLVGLGTSRGEIWAFGKQSIEVWYDAANAIGFPLSPRVGSGLDIGCAAGGSIVAIDNLLMWLDSRGFIVQSDTSNFIRNNSTGYAIRIISTDAMNNEISTYESITDAVAFSYVDRGHIFYQITFPIANKTWVYDHTTKSWHERTYFNTFLNQDEYHLAQYYARYNDINIIGGLRDGKLYIMAPDIFDDDGTIIHRIRTTSPKQIDFILAGVGTLYLRMLSGVAPQGMDPKVALRYSRDGGHTWSNELTRSIGQVGEYAHLITWSRLGTAREWVFEFVISDATDFAIIDASVIDLDTDRPIPRPTLDQAGSSSNKEGS